MPKKSKVKELKVNDIKEPEDTDMSLEEDDCPEYLEEIEHDVAFGTIFKNIHLSTLITFILGILVGIVFLVLEYVIHAPDWAITLVGFTGGLLIVFGASELIILGVQGIKDKLNWNPYLAGILSAIGAALAELVVVTFLLIDSYKLSFSEDSADLAKAANLSTTAIILILTTVIINILFLGISMIFISRKGPFKLPKELTMYESNLVLGIRVFVFIMLLYGLFYEFWSIRNPLEDAPVYSRGVEIVIGVALLLVYAIFLIVLTRRYGKKTSTPQTLMTEFFPEPGEEPKVDTPTNIIQMRLLSAKKVTKKEKEAIIAECEAKVKKDKHKNHDALATLRRFPWIVIIFLFILGAGGIVWGGEMLSEGIKKGLVVLEDGLGWDVPILAYAVVVGVISTAPELIVTFRGLLDPDPELKKIGLINQVSAINQTFFVLFGIPFLISGIVGIGIPITINITLVMGLIYIMSTAEKMMIMDDNHFDILEGAVLTILAVVSLLALAFIGG